MGFGVRRAVKAYRTGSGVRSLSGGLAVTLGSAIMLLAGCQLISGGDKLRVDSAASSSGSGAGASTGGTGGEGAVGGAGGAGGMASPQCSNNVCEVGESWLICPQDCMGPRLAAGESHTCYIVDDREVWCWGNNVEGQLGNTSTTESITPTKTDFLTNVHSINAGLEYTCALVDNGTSSWPMYCWGRNDLGQLGTDNCQCDFGSCAAVLSPDIVSEGYSHRMFSTGDGHACSILQDNSLVCWGANDVGQLGQSDGFIYECQSAPYPSGPGSELIAVAAGGTHTCAVDSSGAVWCWGTNDEGELGVPMSVSETTDTPVETNIGGITAIAAGQAHTCALTVAEEVRCWGRNHRGQLGDPTFEETFSASPKDVATVGAAIAITAGRDHTCVLNRSGEVWCWGDHSNGQLGTPDNPGGFTRQAVVVPGLDQVLEVTAGGRHTCARRTQGLMCWGRNSAGQLGDGTKDTSEVPVSVVPFR